VDQPTRINAGPRAELTWIGHSTVRIDLDGVAVLTDPLLVNWLGPLRRYAPPPKPAALHAIDIVLISHLHRDHLDFASLRTLERPYTLVVPAGAGDYARRVGVDDVRELAAGESTHVQSLTLEATPAVHDGFRVPFGPRASTVGYVVRGTRSIYFSGDTGPFPEMAAIAGQTGGLDVALLGVGGWGPTLRGGHLDPGAAAAALRLLRPRLAVPVHYGTYWPIGMRWLRRPRFERPALDFAAHAARIAPGVQIAIPAPGDAVPLPASRDPAPRQPD
jgi:L-ascorbate metabolism protein UlaG (beta-lactamase superfamily)